MDFGASNWFKKDVLLDSVRNSFIRWHGNWAIKATLIHFSFSYKLDQSRLRQTWISCDQEEAACFGIQPVCLQLQSDCVALSLADSIWACCAVLRPSARSSVQNPDLSCFLKIQFTFIFVVPGIEHRALHMLGKLLAVKLCFPAINSTFLF